MPSRAASQSILILAIVILAIVIPVHSARVHGLNPKFIAASMILRETGSGFGSSPIPRESLLLRYTSNDRYHGRTATKWLGHASPCLSVGGWLAGSLDRYPVRRLTPGLLLRCRFGGYGLDPDQIAPARGGQRVKLVARRPADSEEDVGDQYEERGHFGDPCRAETEEGVASDQYKPGFEKNHRRRAVLEHVPGQGVFLVQHSLLVRKDGEGQVEPVQEPNAEHQADDAMGARVDRPMQDLRRPRPSAAGVPNEIGQQRCGGGRHGASIGRVCALDDLRRAPGGPR